MMSALPDRKKLAELLDRFAPFTPAPLSQEIKVFQANSLVQIWEEAEKIAGENLPSPFWAYPWAAGCALARVVLDNPDWFTDQRVLDLGAGGGVVSIAARYAGAAEVVANDVDPWALEVIKLAAERQNLKLTYLLGDLTHDRASADKFDVVLCSDMAYEKRMTPRYAALLQHAKAAGARVIVADAGRKYFDPAGMKLIAEYTLAVPRDLEGVAERTARVYEL
jgi:predicted nicotinamide N-methyase